MDIRKIVLATLLVWMLRLTVIGVICGSFFKWMYQIPPLIWKDSWIILSPGNIIASMVSCLGVSFIFVVIYAWIHSILPGNKLTKGFNYGFIVWLLGTLSVMATFSMIITIDPSVLVYWMMQGLSVALISGAAVALIYTRNYQPKKR